MFSWKTKTFLNDSKPLNDSVPFLNGGFIVWLLCYTRFILAGCNWQLSILNKKSCSFSIALLIT